jgi:hypothetical protein
MKSIATLCVCLASLAGCAADPDLDEPGASVEALGEAACGTVSGYPFAGALANGRSQLVGAMPHCSVATTASTSPSASYSNAGCTNQYVSEVRGVTGRALTAHAAWAGPALNAEGICGVSAMGFALYGRRANGTWTKVGQTHLVGRWIPASTGGGFQLPARCEFVRPTGEPATPSLPTGHAYNAVRTVGYAISLFVPQRVRLGVSYGTGPC